jgi:hypothetical protein
MKINKTIDKLIQLFFEPPRRISYRLRVWADRLLKNDTFKLEGKEIISGSGKSAADKVQVEMIKNWSLEHEMLFNIIRIELQTGEVITWLDKYDQLLPILRSVAPDKFVKV